MGDFIHKSVQGRKTKQPLKTRTLNPGVKSWIERSVKNAWDASSGENPKHPLLERFQEYYKYIRYLYLLNQISIVFRRSKFYNYCIIKC